VTFTGLKFNATDTASAAASLLMDLQVGGTSQASFDKRGTLSFNGPASGTAPSRPGIGNWFGALALFGTGGTLGATLSSAQLNVGASGGIALSSDTILTRRGAANLRFGAADAAAPVAQTLSVQSVVAGTTNTAGANLTITGSQGTGNAAGGSIIFQVAPAGSTGTAQNALAAALEVTSQRWLVAGPRLYFNNTTTSAAYFDVITNGIIDFHLSGNRIIRFGQGGDISTGSVQFGASSGGDGSGALVTADGPDRLALRRGANAQESRIYGSFTSATNFQRMSIKTLRESSGALSGATYVTTIAIPAYANLIGVTTRVTTAVTGATTYDVGDGTDVDLWGAAIGVAIGSQSRTADFTAVGAVGAAATSRTVTLTANGSNFTGGVIEICLHYLTTEAD
jgi:hypothetical protein